MNNIAGNDQSITLPENGAQLAGSAGDDGLPYGSVNTIWSLVSGPGSVTFANVNAIDSSASFSVAGTYTLRLTANCRELSSSYDVTITIAA